MKLHLWQAYGGWNWRASWRGNTRSGWAKTRTGAISARLLGMYELLEQARSSGWEGGLAS